MPPRSIPVCLSILGLLEDMVLIDLLGVEELGEEELGEGVPYAISLLLW